MRFQRERRRAALAAQALAFLLACDPGVFAYNPVATVRLQPTVDTLGEGQTAVLIATTLDQGGHTTVPQHHAIWESLAPTIVQVDSNGKVSGLAAGFGVIRVTIDNKVATATVVVTPAPVGFVALAPANLTVTRGDTVQFTVQVHTTLGHAVPNPVVTWSVTDSSKMRIDSVGKGITLQVGAVVVRATVQGISDSTTTKILVPIASLVLSPLTATLAYDDSARFQLIAMDSAGNLLAQHVPITVGAPSVLAIGVLAADTTIVTAHALMPGQSTIIAASHRLADTAAITVPVLSLHQLQAGGDFSCGLAADSAAYCWGDNAAGELGTGTLTDDYRPRRVAGGRKFVSLSTGFSSTCATTASGAGYCWGDNDQGELGSKAGGVCLNVQCDSIPALVSGGIALATVTVGTAHACGVSVGGAAYCWGGPVWGFSPTLVMGPVQFLVALPAGDRGDDCGWAADSTVYCWSGSASTPTSLSGSVQFVSVARSAGLSCGVTATGDLYCWGGVPSSNGSLNPLSFTPFLPGNTFRQVAPGRLHLCGITTAGATMCWGNNEFGQLGDGTFTDDYGTGLATVQTPVPLVSLSSGDLHTCGVGTNGLVYCWGNNTFGRLGSTAAPDATTPQLVVFQQ